MMRNLLVCVLITTACGGNVVVNDIDASDAYHVDGAVISPDVPVDDAAQSILATSDSGVGHEAHDTPDASTDSAVDASTDAGVDASTIGHVDTGLCASTLCASGYSSLYDGDADGYCNDCDVCDGGDDGKDANSDGYADDCDQPIIVVSDSVVISEPPGDVTIKLTGIRSGDPGSVYINFPPINMPSENVTITAEGSGEVNDVSKIQEFVMVPTEWMITASGNNGGPVAIPLTVIAQETRTSLDMSLYRATATILYTAAGKLFITVIVRGRLLS